VISPFNVKALAETVETARSLGFSEIRFQHLMFTTTDTASALDPFLQSIAARLHVSAYVLPHGALDLAELTTQLEQIRTRASGQITVRFEPDLKKEDFAAYYEQRNDAFLPLCLSPWRRLDVSPYGEMGPCQGMYLGRFPGIEPSMLWNGPAFRALRRYMLAQGLFPNCVRCCHREYYPPHIGLTVS
jgi:hypothetical protein